MGSNLVNHLREHRTIEYVRTQSTPTGEDDGEAWVMDLPRTGSTKIKKWADTASGFLHKSGWSSTVSAQAGHLTELLIKERFMKIDWFDAINKNGLPPQKNQKMHTITLNGLCRYAVFPPATAISGSASSHSRAQSLQRCLVTKTSIGCLRVEHSLLCRKMKGSCNVNRL